MTKTSKILASFSRSKEDIYELHSAKEKYSEFFESHDSLKNLSFLQNEIAELIEAVQNKDTTEIQKETNDVIYTLLNSLIALEKEGNTFNYSDQKEKIFKRSPFLEEGTKKTQEEEDQIWIESKKQNN